VATLTDAAVAHLQVVSLVFLAAALVFCFWARNRALTRVGQHSSAAPTVKTPGWVARRRARGGVSHPKGGATLGYRTAFSTVGLTAREFSLGGLCLGAPGSGKTNLAQLLVQALAGNQTAGVILDPKPSRDLAATVAAAGGTIWTLGGDLQWDALPDDPTELANQLLEIESTTGEMRVYRNAARLQALAIGQYLQRKGEHPTLERMAMMMTPGTLANRPEVIKLSQTEWEGVRSFGTSLQVLARGAAGRSLAGQLGNGPRLRLEDTIAEGKIILFQLEFGRYPEETRQLGAWILRAMLRLLRQPHPCWLIADEFARLGWQGRHALDLLALGREFKKPVVLMSQGPSDFREISPHALAQAAQDAAWILCFRQGTQDSDLAARLLGVHRVDERSVSYGYDTREHVRVVEQPIVPASVLEDMTAGTAYLRVPPIQRKHARVEPLRVAMPVPAELMSPGDSYRTANSGDKGTQKETGLAAPSDNVGTFDAPPDPRIAKYTDIVGPHWVWKANAPVNDSGYPRLKIAGKYQYVHIYWWESVNGPRPIGDDGEPLTIDHDCPYGVRCVWPGCKRLLTRGGNTSARWARERGE
jgi:hypothetical protein